MVALANRGFSYPIAINNRNNPINPPHANDIQATLIFKLIAMKSQIMEP